MILLHAHRDNLRTILHQYDTFLKTVSKCQEYYELNNYVTIDEMLGSFRSRHFRQNIPNKSTKYGLKIITLVDSKTYYSYNFEMCAGKQPNGPYQVNSSAFNVMKRLTVSNSGQNITCDNWFTYIPLADDLLNNNNLPMVGTSQKNKREILPVFYKISKKDRLTVVFLVLEMT